MRPLSARDAVLTPYAQSLIRHKARQLSRQPGFTSSDAEDLVQELTLRLFGQADYFDPKRASWDTFADRVIQSAVKMILRHRAAQKRAAGFTTRSLERGGAASDDSAGFLRNALTEGDLRRRMGTANDDADRAGLIAPVLAAFRSLSPDLQDLCSRLIDGSAVSAARDLGISRRQVLKAMERIRRHFEDAGLGDF